MSVHTVWSRSTCSCWQQRWEMPSSGHREAQTNRVDRFEEEPQSVETRAAILDALEASMNQCGGREGGKEGGREGGEQSNQVAGLADCVMCGRGEEKDIRERQARNAAISSRAGERCVQPGEPGLNHILGQQTPTTLPNLQRGALGSKMAIKA
ncbi:hypothetical protein EYF80_012824 [Liparis tanakae]|uniref:Uncharacterized protein n=1 Tax=Liparis tanakae TaxID=230148 RepID=A0A4Z2IGE4_9TELE|nr:hypothetical protein EYF80_012824 [Liparis tanakae]